MRPSNSRHRAWSVALAMVALVAWSCGNASPTPSPTLESAPTISATATPTASAPSATPSAAPSSGEPSPAATDVVAHAAPPSKPPIAAGPTPPPLPRRTVTIAAAGDIACDQAHNTGQPKDCDQMATAALIGSLHPTAVLTLGDNQYENGTAAAYAASYGPSWGRFKSITFPTIGNHEYLTSGAAGYFNYFNIPQYYSYNLGNWHMISLNSECSHVGGCQAGSRQETWLQADLAANPVPCTLVTWHEPRWSSGQHGNAAQMTAIWNDLVAANVDVVLSGHNHDYERFAPLDGNGQPAASGTMEFVVGTGGKNDYAFAKSPLSGEAARATGIFGVLSMTLGSTSFSWRFVSAPGFSFTDAGSASCH